MSLKNLDFEDIWKKSLEINHHLPIAPRINEGLYSNHLWAVFSTLLKSIEQVQPFCIMPFHLLFIMSIQYKIKRIYELYPNDYKKSLIHLPDRNKKDLTEIDSVFRVALFNERSLGEIFKLIDLDTNVIKKIKELVDYRNEKLAHPKGSIDYSFYEKIDNYISTLDLISEKMIEENNKVIEDKIINYFRDQDYEINRENLENSLFGSELTYKDFENSDHSDLTKIIDEFYFT